MRSVIKFVLAFACLCGSVLADGDQPNGGRTDCTTNCPPPCTENCGSAFEGSGEDAAETSEFEFIADDILVIFANEMYRMYL